MHSAIQSQNELLTRTNGSAMPAGVKFELPPPTDFARTKITVVVNAPQLTQKLSGFIGADELLASLDPTEREVSDANKWLHTHFYGDLPVTIRSLRLKAGFSQQQLATAIGTSQPHISRIESGSENITWDVGRRLAAALAVDMNEFDLALKNQQTR